MGGDDWADIQAGIDTLISEGLADGDRLGICGWSYGGYMTAWAVGQTTRFKAAMAGAAITDWPSFHGRSYLHTWDRKHYGNSDPYDAASNHARFNPFAYVRAVSTPTLFLHGELDWDVPVEQAYFMYRALRDNGVETQLVVYPREPHGFSEYAHRLDMLERIRDWMLEYLVTRPAAAAAARPASGTPATPSGTLGLVGTSAAAAGGAAAASGSSGAASAGNGSEASAASTPAPARRLRRPRSG
jgi:dipeptidyl aminopeptidase/acylaminoacyl peptidase